MTGSEKNLIIKQIKNYDRLQPNWDGYLADPIPALVRKQAIWVAIYLSNKPDFAIESVRPSTIGSVEFILKRKDIMVEVNKEEILGILFDCKGDVLMVRSFKHYTRGIVKWFRSLK